MSSGQHGGQLAGQLGGLRVTLLTAWASRLGGGVATALYTHIAMLRDAGARVTVVALFLAVQQKAFRRALFRTAAACAMAPARQLARPIR